MSNGIDSMNVMFVRRVGTPVACGRLDFHGNQPLAMEAGRENGVDLAGGTATSADFDGSRFGCNLARRVASSPQAPTVSDIKLIRGGLEMKFRVGRQKQAIR